MPLDGRQVRSAFIAAEVLQRGETTRCAKTGLTVLAGRSTAFDPWRMLGKSASRHVRNVQPRQGLSLATLSARSAIAALASLPVYQLRCCNSVSTSSVVAVSPSRGKIFWTL